MLLIQEKFDLIDFVADVGDYSAGKMCVMSAAVAEWRLRNGEPLGRATDELNCACPVVRRLAIYLNDLSGYWTDKVRREWALSMVPRLIDSRGDKATTLSRLELAVAFANRMAAYAAASAEYAAASAAYAAASAASAAEYAAASAASAAEYAAASAASAAEYAAASAALIGDDLRATIDAMLAVSDNTAPATAGKE